MHVMAVQMHQTNAVFAVHLDWEARVPQTFTQRWLVHWCKICLMASMAQYSRMVKLGQAKHTQWEQATLAKTIHSPVECFLTTSQELGRTPS